ncbi:MAG: YcxB family protein [Trichodesmium sp.]
MIFQQDEMVEICVYQELKLRWFYKHITTPKIMLIFLNPQNCIIVPKKDCFSEEQYEKICHLIDKFPQGY